VKPDEPVNGGRGHGRGGRGAPLDVRVGAALLAVVFEVVYFRGWVSSNWSICMRCCARFEDWSMLGVRDETWRMAGCRI
jgi:hypothetical protein